MASEAAQARNRDYLGTEHLLVGLLREGDGVAAKTLESLGLSVEAVDSRISCSEQPQAGRSGQIPFTPRAKIVLEQSTRETALLGHDHIGTEHLLLALIDSRESTGARLLGEVAPVDIAEVRQQILRQVAEYRRVSDSAQLAHVTCVELTEAEQALCAVVAAKSGQNLDAWMRERILEAARALRPDTE
ncbi:ATP-binding protein [Rhodococcus maanshanensis]|uniref:Clp protease N-terminal domain-containing protein n=1 Tax=Rhodococcus maanshanensis TaxID=183556 RepID=UPI0022B4F6AC|nr:Clp protease N-terminal domain-containing protein [Rhodococcus maanshanensis]MCZ4554189.1 ATP-binding protein [Rhodococcus maanshanensis]